MIGPLGYGRSGESPWLWLIIIGGGVCLYVWGRLRGWPRVRRWADVADRLYLVGAPWWLQALFLAIIGGGSLYHLAFGALPVVLVVPTGRRLAGVCRGGREEEEGWSSPGPELDYWEGEE